VLYLVTLFKKQRLTLPL